MNTRNPSISIDPIMLISDICTIVNSGTIYVDIEISDHKTTYVCPEIPIYLSAIIETSGIGILENRTNTEIAYIYVWHRGLIHNLEKYGIKGNLLAWLNSYLYVRH